jgi:hypothetical protein
VRDRSPNDYRPRGPDDNISGMRGGWTKDRSLVVDLWLAGSGSLVAAAASRCAASGQQ